MVSATSASRYIMSTFSCHPRYQSRSSMYIRGLILRNFAELTEAVPIEKVTYYDQEKLQSQTTDQPMVP